MVEENRNVLVILDSYNLNTLDKTLGCLTDTTFRQLETWSIHVVVLNTDFDVGGLNGMSALESRYPNLSFVKMQSFSNKDAKAVQRSSSIVKESSAEVVIRIYREMENPAELLSSLLDKINTGADIIWGIKKTSEKQSFSIEILIMLMLKKLHTFLIRFLLFFPFREVIAIRNPIADVKAIRIGGAFRVTDIDDNYVNQPNYALEVDYNKIQLGCKVTEVPAYVEVSSLKEVKWKNTRYSDLILTALRLRWRDESTKRFMRFAVVGFTGFIINATSLELFSRSQLVNKIAQLFFFLRQIRFIGVVAHSTSWAAALAAECAIISNYICNNFWTFSKNRPKKLLKFVTNFLKFNVTSIGAIILQFLFVGFATYMIADTPIIRQISLIMTVLFVIIPYNWFIYNRYIWKTKVKSKTK